MGRRSTGTSMKSPRGYALTATVVVAIALLAPAIASAEGPFWYVNGAKVSESVAFTATGELTFALPFGESPLQAGPCGGELKGTLKNGGSAAETTVTSLLPPSTCPTSRLGCYLQSPKPDELPWSGTAQAGANLFAQDFAMSAMTMGCGALIPPRASLRGTLHGPWSNTTRCLEYKEAGELLLVGFGKPVPTSGTICFTTPGGTLTLK